MGSKLLQTLKTDGIHAPGREPISQSNPSSSLSCGLDGSREMGLFLDVNSLESREGKGQRKAIFTWEQIIFLDFSIHPEHDQQREKLVH